jgi:hypothetical protein
MDEHEHRNDPLIASAGNGKIQGGRIDPKGFDAGEKISGKKRHVLVDTEGLVMYAVVHLADVQDRDGGVLVLATLLGLFPFARSFLPTAAIKGRNSASSWRKCCLSFLSKL